MRSCRLAHNSSMIHAAAVGCVSKQMLCTGLDMFAVCRHLRINIFLLLLVWVLVEAYNRDVRASDTLKLGNGGNCLDLL